MTARRRLLGMPNKSEPTEAELLDMLEESERELVAKWADGPAEKQAGAP